MEKKLSGQGHLTEKIINKLQNYYGIAIGSTCYENVHSLKVAIGAALYTALQLQVKKLDIIFVQQEKIPGVSIMQIKILTDPN